MSAVDRAPNGARKAAILLSFLGEEEAAPVLRNLSSEDLDKITREVASLARVPVDITLQVLEEYHQMMAASEFISSGGREVATRFLVKAFGEAGASKMVQRLTHPEEDNSLKFDALKKTEPQQLARFLAGEHVQTKALILGHLDPKQSSALLMKLDPESRVDCIRRMATIGQFSPEAAAKASRVLNKRFGSAVDQRKGGAGSDSGVKNLADLMNRLEPSAAREILQSIEADDPKLAISIRDLMFTFENFLEVPEPDMRELMNMVDKKTLMVALKGASDDLRAHIFRTMSSRAVEMMKEDSEMMGPVRGKDVAKAQSEIVAIARKLESEGKIVLKSEGEDEYVL
ncbi:MAG TPA: flagellar motor switch protein FliG [Terracidiphilus sp.]|nr:flagellar motor switch protein FliG [Terracidiphilus sp.]